MVPMTDNVDIAQRIFHSHMLGLSGQPDMDWNARQADYPIAGPSGLQRVKRGRGVSGEGKQGKTPASSNVALDGK